jgi:vanillate/3-O-methylgallate O-demethylase
VGCIVLPVRTKSGSPKDRLSFPSATLTAGWLFSSLSAAALGRVMTSLLERGDPCKFFDVPNCNYASSSFDAVTRGGRTVGLSMFGGYSYNERCGLSLGVVDADVQIGEELTLVWGEEDGGTRKPTVERHRQCEVRVKVGPTPYSRDAREGYHAGWRTRQSATA